MSRVYVVQNQMRWDRERQTIVPKFDVTPAEEYGDLDFLLGPHAAPWNPESVLDDLYHKLSHYKPEDYILLIGNPVLIGMTVGVAALQTGGLVKFLQWSGKDRRYIAIEADLYREQEP